MAQWKYQLISSVLYSPKILNSKISHVISEGDFKCIQYYDSLAYWKFRRKKVFCALMNYLTNFCSQQVYYLPWKIKNPNVLTSFLELWDKYFLNMLLNSSLEMVSHYHTSLSHKKAGSGAKGSSNSYDGYQPYVNLLNWCQILRQGNYMKKKTRAWHKFLTAKWSRKPTILVIQFKLVELRREPPILLS